MAGSWALAANRAEGFSAEEVRWLNRITYGVHGAAEERYRLLGRKRFLAAQLPGPLERSLEWMLF